MSARTLFAVDIDLGVPGRIVHEVSADGLTFHSRYESPGGGSADAKVSWTDLSNAQANYENARQAANRRAPAFSKAINDATPGSVDRSRVRFLVRGARGDLTLFTNAGPPTWWLPRLQPLVGTPTKNGRRQYGIRGGWIRRAFVLAYATKPETAGSPG